jgi:hypothetical protein
MEPDEQTYVKMADEMDARKDDSDYVEVDSARIRKLQLDAALWQIEETKTRITALEKIIKTAM